MKCNTIQYSTLQYNTIQYNTIQYSAIQYNANTIQYSAIQYNIILKDTIYCGEFFAIMCGFDLLKTYQYLDCQLQAVSDHDYHQRKLLSLKVTY